MKRDPGEHLFTFAVITDSHVNQAEDRSVSPYLSNRSANGRLRFVVRCLEAFDLAFVAHLGDMGNPLPHLGSYTEAASCFRSITKDLRCPLHLVPGNHCVGDKPVGWVPVPRVSRQSLSLYEETYGQHFYSFDEGPCHFVTLNSLLINSGLRLEGEQRRWLQKDLEQATSQSQRIFLLMHYPPYVAAPDEPAGYDNLDEPGRSWLLELLARHRVAAAYSGHVHNFFYDRYVDTDLYTLPATSFVRQDYSDMYSVQPEDAEGGRDEAAKLGYSIVRVFECGHAVQVVRTQGQVMVEGDASGSERSAGSSIVPQRIGVEVRENWLARTTLRPNNSVSPFVRRWARNDWPVVALDEMGISKLRISLHELADRELLERVETLTANGYEFAAYSFGIPTELQYRLAREARSVLVGWELILGLDQIKSVSRGVARLAPNSRGQERLPLYLSEVRDIARAETEDANVKHEANYGFQLEEKRRIARLLDSPAIVDTFDGLVFRLRRRGESVRSPWEAIRQIGRLGLASAMRHQVHVLFSGSFTSDRMLDDLGTANRVAEATLAAWATGSVDVFLDTFEDVDRGYFVRNGLVDRRYNPRLAANVVRHLGGVLATLDPIEVQGGSIMDLSDGRLWTSVGEQGLRALLLPRCDCRLESIGVNGDLRSATLSVINLVDGRSSKVEAESLRSALRLAKPLVASGPLWIQTN